MATLRLLHVMTVPISLFFLRGQGRFFRTLGLEEQAISSPGPDLVRFSAEEGIAVHAVPMLRAITPLRDLVAVWRLYRVFRQLKPAIVHAGTPKGGLLAMVAAWLARVPVRVYHIYGLPAMTARGIRRLILQATERVSCALADHVFCAGPSIRDYVVARGICRSVKTEALLRGSINGIEARRLFNPELHAASRAGTRSRLGIPQQAVVLGFVGRLVGDKGVAELWEALRRVQAEAPELHLLIVGESDTRDPLSPTLIDALRSHPRVHFAGFVRNTPPLYAAMDLVALPSHREGFPVVPMEAAAMALPVIATRIPGCVDAVQDGVTGILVQPGDAAALADAIRGYLRDPTLARRHGEAGRARMLRDFQPEKIWEALAARYDSLLAKRHLPLLERRAAGTPPAAPSTVTGAPDGGDDALLRIGAQAARAGQADTAAEEIGRDASTDSIR